MAKDNQKLPSRSKPNDVDAFLDKVARTAVVKAPGTRGRLVFAMDATASREPSWDRACHIQAQMFTETDALGGLDVQLAYYRGFGDFRATGWASNSRQLLEVMTGVRCLGGHTQIAKVLDHAIRETQAKSVDAVVFVGDCCEEDVDNLCHLAGRLGLLGVPVFLFHEGGEPIARSAFQQIARLTGGAYCSFDSGSAQQLRELLAAVAVFAAGGRRALEDYGAKTGGAVLQITRQIR